MPGLYDVASDATTLNAVTGGRVRRTAPETAAMACNGFGHLVSGLRNIRVSSECRYWLYGCMVVWLHGLLTTNWGIPQIDQKKKTK